MDGGDGTADLVINKRFVSESELEERRKRRQEEWEKVRKPEDPEGMGYILIIIGKRLENI
uniref:FAM192A/Fyv6 N-terminal domain-containing protein n=1 Tax=Strix occidentalis caurina TaxID=311401 RepID=A0A8D0ESS4_STROC